MTSLHNEADFDNRESIEVDLSDEDFLRIAKMAHARDITFNKMVELILTEEMIRSGWDPETKSFLNSEEC